MGGRILLTSLRNRCSVLWRQRAGNGSWTPPHPQPSKAWAGGKGAGLTPDNYLPPTVDPNKERCEAVKLKITKYLRRAEEIFNCHLQRTLGSRASADTVRTPLPWGQRALRGES